MMTVYWIRCVLWCYGISWIVVYVDSSDGVSGLLLC